MALAAALFATTAAQAEITVGFVTSLSGPGSSIGVLYDRGMKAAVEYANTVSGEKIKLIQLDDGSDPSAATRNARKLVEEEQGRPADRHRDRAVVHRHGGGRQRAQGADDLDLADHGAGHRTGDRCGRSPCRSRRA